MARQYRQGDVFLVKTTIPGTAVGVKAAGRIVLAAGEVTGHAHAIVLDRLPIGAMASMLKDVEREFVRIEGGEVAVEHEEHATVMLPPGEYEIVHQREYTPEEIRRVAD